MTSATPLVISGFYTGVDRGRYRIFDLHQSYLCVSGASPRYVYCTGAALGDEHRVTGIRYLHAALADPEPVRTLCAMAQAGANLARAEGTPWFVSTHSDIWGPARDWARRLVTTGLRLNPRAQMIAVAYAAGAYGARLFAIRPGFAEALFDDEHAPGYAMACAQHGAAVLYERYLRDRVHALGETARVALLPGRSIRKKARHGSAARTIVPAHPRLFHDHSHVYEAIKDKWYRHRMEGAEHVVP